MCNFHQISELSSFKLFLSSQSQGDDPLTNMHTPMRNKVSHQSIIEANETNGLGLYDVICGRHKAALDNIGNRRFRVLVSLAQEKYASTSTRTHKSSVIKDVIHSVHHGGGRFLQRLAGVWVELDEKQTHDKVGHALRDMAVASKVKIGSQKLLRNNINVPDHWNPMNTSSHLKKPNTTSLTDALPSMSDHDGNIVSLPSIVSLPNIRYEDNFKGSDITINTKDIELDENDTDTSTTTESFEAIVWPGRQQSHRRSQPVDEHIISMIFLEQ
jgi:hypothetical protein